MSSPEDNEPDDTPVPPESNPPDVPEEPAAPINPLIQGMLTAIEPVFKKMEVAVTNLERRAVDQQHQIEDVVRSIDARIAEGVAIYEKARQANEEADVVPPGQNPFQKAPAMGGIGGFVQQIMGWVLSPQGTQLIQQFQGGGSDMAFFKNWYGAAHEAFDRSMIRNMAKITGLSGLPEPLEMAAETVHEVVGDHV